MLLCCWYDLCSECFTYMPGIRSETFGCAVVLVDAVVFIKCWAKLVPSVLFLVITKARRNLAMYFERGFHENPNVSHQNNILCEADSVSNWMNHFHEKNCCLLQNTQKDAALTAVVLLLRILLNDDVFYLETYMSMSRKQNMN